MRRRGFLSGLGGAAVGLPLAAGALSALAQTPGRIYRLGHLTNTKLSETLTRETTLPALAKLGFMEGVNLVFDARAGEVAALPGLAHELLSAKADAVIAIGDAAIRAMAGASTTVPIIAFGSDPVKLGFAKTYARPGGNLTGVTILSDELEVVRLAMLRDAVPGRRRIAVLMSQSQRAVIEPAVRKAAPGLGIDLLVFPVSTPADYPGAFAAIRAAGAQAVVIGAAPELFRDGKQLAALALEAKLPTICEWAEMARTGCLIGHGPSRAELRKRIAAQIALILRGDAPGNVAIELPVKFETTINLQVARQLGLTIPFAVRASADEVIE